MRVASMASTTGGAETIGGDVNGHTLGLVVGGVVAIWHLAWAALVFVGWAQAVMDFIFWLHFIEPALRIGAFSLSRTIGLLFVTGTVGYLLGRIAAAMWNAARIG